MSDSLLEFVESARLMLVREGGDNAEEHTMMMLGLEGPSWSWVCSRIIQCCKSYSSGVTPAILLSDLFKAWMEKSRVEKKGKWKEKSLKQHLGIQSFKKQKQVKSSLTNVLSDIITIDSIYEKKFVSLDAVLEVTILDVHLLPGTDIYLLTLGDAWSSSSIDLYLHHKFYDLIEGQHGVLRKGREIRLTGCRLRTALATGCSQPRLLPTEYLAIILDEEQDEDALLLGAKFCFDTFSSIHWDSVAVGGEYCLYVRLEKIEEAEIQVQTKHLKQQKLLLYDSNGDKLPLILWDEQICLARLFSEGSMIAIEKPFIAEDKLCGLVTNFGFCLEYGSATYLYTVPCAQHEEQVLVDPTQGRSKAKLINQSSDFMGNNGSQNSCLSQVMLPRDSQGSINYCNFPLRLFVVDVRQRMSRFSLFGVVKSLHPTCTVHEAVDHGRAPDFIMVIEDQTGSLIVQLQFHDGWNAGELFPGHIVYISGLTSHSGGEERLECTWNEKDAGASIVNMTQLSALLTSSCLHQITPISQLSSNNFCIQVCKVRLVKLELHHCQLIPAHIRCGRPSSTRSDGTFYCGFCQCLCDEVIDNLSIVVTLNDTNDNGEVSASCFGQCTTTILQASPNDFCSWPEDEQALYVYSLQNDEFIVTMFWSAEDALYLEEGSSVHWKIGNALKC